MEDIEKLIIDIKNNLYSNDDDFYNSIEPLYKYIGRKMLKIKDYFKFEEFINYKLIPHINKNLNIKEKIVFCYRTSLIEYKINNRIIPKYLFKDIIINEIDNYGNEFINTLQDIKLQEMYCKWFININGSVNNFKNEIYTKLFNLQRFKEIVLENNEFISDNFFLDLTFFEKLPKEYGYLIGLINSKNIPIKLTFKIYNKLFDGIIKRSTQLELLKVNMIIDNTDYSFGVDKKTKRLEFTNCLKKICINKNYYKFLKGLSKKSKLDLKYIISFADKYDNTDFFIEICSKNKLDKDIIKKVKYLSISEKVLNIDIIKSLSDISLNDLINLEKENNTEIGIYGGPISKKNENLLFSIDSSTKEIRRINKDGSIDVKKLDSYGSHSSGIDSIYYELEFNNNDTVFEKAIQAIKELDSITFIIEGEACLMVIPINISNEQKEQLINWIIKSNKDANIGINIYNKENNKNEILLCNEMERKDIIEYIYNLNSKEKKYTYNM